MEGWKKKFTSGFELAENLGKVCKLKKALYGLKQSPKAWFIKFSTTMRILGYQQEQANHTMFIKQTKNGRKSILVVYVDDMILANDDVTGIQQLKECLQAKFKVKDLRTIKYFLGMEVVKSKKGEL